MLVLAIMGAGTVTATASPLAAVAPPQVSVPSVPVPEVSVPEVSVPDVSVPEVSVPAVPAPAAPAPAPVIEAPAARSVSVPAAVAPTGTRAVGPTVEAVGERVIASGGSLSLGPGAGDSEQAAERRREAARHRRAVRTTIQRLRRKLRKVDHCLHLLPGKSRRALRLHLGLGDAEPRSRQAVARRMGTSWWRIRRIERRSLVQLRRADRADACGERTGAAASFAVADTGTGGFAPASFTTPPLANDAPAQEQDRGRAQGGARGETESGSDPRGNGRSGPIGLVDSAAEDLQTLALILVGLVGAGFVLALLGRLRRTGGPAG